VLAPRTENGRRIGDDRDEVAGDCHMIYTLVFCLNNEERRAKYTSVR
jgi:hypothetical protein